jgi:anaerobic selenocysteine-containing dehydrogenase
MTANPTGERLQICRICHNACPIVVDVEAGRAVRVRGDRSNPVYHGYICPKGASLPSFHNDPRRILHPLKRMQTGGFEQIPLEQALDEIAERLGGILVDSGPRSVMGYAATGVQPQVVMFSMLYSFLTAIECPWPPFSASSIDQAGKATARALHGYWQAPPQGFDDPDVALMVGVNPLVSHTGTPQGSPMEWLRSRQRAGMQLIVVDPRRSETARHAQIHLQARPGQDAAVLAGIIRVILDENLHDIRFVEDATSGVEALREAVASYTPEYVAERAGIEARDVIEAARVFASAKRGYACAGTGANMSGQATLVEYLVLVLMALCGRYLREGEVVHGAPVLRRPIDYRAQAVSPVPVPTLSPSLRVPGRTHAAVEHQIMDLVDEMRLEGEGRIRALLVMGGNPVAAWPDQARAIDGLRKLDLLVVVDPLLGATARLADYVIPPKLLLEVAAATTLQDYFSDSINVGYVEAHAQYVPPAVEPPEGSETIEEWEFLYEIARRLGRTLHLGRDVLDPERRPTTEELLERMTRHARVPLETVKASPHGAVFVDDSIRVNAADPDAGGRLDVGNESMMADLKAIACSESAASTTPAYPFRLISRRMRHVQNSMLQGYVRGRAPGNPAYMHPKDLDRLGIHEGDTIEIQSALGRIEGRVEVDAGLRPGLVSMAHGFGDLPEVLGADRWPGGNTGVLVDVDHDHDPYTGQPRMSDVPVQIRGL